MIFMHRRPSSRGFSLLELLIVVAIALIVTAVAIPGIMNATDAFKLRSAASGVSGLIQQGRMLAVSRNAFCRNASGTLYVDVNSSGANDAGDVIVGTLQLPRGMSLVNTGAPSNTTIINGLTPDLGLPLFNPRGLPCFGAPCVVDSAKIYVTYVRQDRTLGTPAWAAITVTPAGRVRIWTWDGTNWE
jgi:prepilin-type N-terminal cleavage/methylation domain-containing protein